ncbi:unnamed protein product [Sphagnum tenellum]
MDSRRGPPHVGGSHWLSTDIIYQPGSSSGNSSRVIRMDEAGESSSGGRGFYRQDCGKGPESSRPPIHKPAAQVSSKLVATRSSGARRMQRAQQGSLQGPWNVLQSYPGGLNDPALECTGMDVPGSSATEYFPSRRGHVTEHIGAWNGMSGVPPLGSRQAQAGADVAYPRVSIGSIGIEERQGGDVGGSMSFNSLNSFYRDHQDFLNEGRSGFNEKRADDSSGSVTYNSLYVDHPNYMDEGNLQASSSNYAHSAQVEAFWAAASKHHASLDTHVACRSNVFPISTERHSLRSNLPGKTSESGASSSGNASSTSRSSACKRKSCTPVAAGSSSSQSCTSASDVGASTSSSAEATCRGLGFVPLVGTGTEDPRTSHFGSETELLLEARRDSRAGKNAVSSSSTSGNPHGFTQILLALERVERDEDLTYEQLLMLEATLLFGGMGLHDQHSDLRLDVDNMSYEELLALEERIGNVSTGVTAEVAAQKLKRSQYSSLDAMVAHFSEECDIKCSICQEEYVEGDELGKIDCGHGYHVSCIQQWLVQKNQCPICKATALS